MLTSDNAVKRQMTVNFGSNPTFGTPSTGASSFAFGNPSTTTKPSTGFGTGMIMGVPASTGTNFSFGSNAQATSTGFGGFGTGFGTTTTAAQPSLFGTQTTLSFGTQPTQPGFTGFGAQTQTTFSGLGAPPQTTFSGFGAPAQATSTGFGTTFSGFGAPATTTSSIFGFGSTTTTTAPSLFSGFNQQPTGLNNFVSKPFGVPLTFGTANTLGQGLSQQPPQQQQQVSGVEQITNSIFNCLMFGDEHDKILAKLNMLQACWGTGKGYYSPNCAPVEYTPSNPYFKFKSIVYGMKPGKEAKDKLVVLQVNKKQEDIRIDNFKTSLGNVLGNKPNLVIQVDQIRPFMENLSLVFIKAEEKLQNGQTRKVLNTDITTFLHQTTQKTQLEAMGVYGVYPFVSPDSDNIKEYLNIPPPGIDPVMWRKAKEQNPDPEKLVPVPLFGISELKWRHNCQVEETKRHEAFVDKIAESISTLKRENETSQLKLKEYKQKITELDHRILKLMVKHQISRNVGVALQPEEEVMKRRLDSIQAQLNSPQFNGRLNELLTQVKLHKEQSTQQQSDMYKMTDVMQEEVKQFLVMQQNGIKSLINIIQSDLADLKKIEIDLGNLSKS